MNKNYAIITGVVLAFLILSPIWICLVILGMVVTMSICIIGIFSDRIRGNVSVMRSDLVMRSTQMFMSNMMKSNRRM